LVHRGILPRSLAELTRESHKGAPMTHKPRGDPVTKPVEPAKTVKAAIQKVLGGDMYLSEKMSSSVINRLMRGQADEPGSRLEKLSDRELEVFRALGQGKGVRRIAEDLSLTIPTINSFRHRIKQKLGLKSSTEVMLHAIQWVQGEGAK